MTATNLTKDRSHAGRRWTVAAVAAAAFFILFVSIQTIVPLIRLWAPRPARFGWQMYSARPQRVRFTLVLRNGTTQPVDLARYVGFSRGEVTLEQALPQHLCRVVPDVSSVQIRRADSKEQRVHRCP
ncbi:MAG TPA: hypothetical protein VHW00_06710 [Thermoanaerobaculia bacterium]|nr:hypothetical protein [Thermoanaerobaculia bacterium]